MKECNLYLAKVACVNNDDLEIVHEVTLIAADSYADAARIIEECYECDLAYIQHLEAYDTIVPVEELTEACDTLLEE